MSTRIAWPADRGSVVEGPPTGWRPRALSMREKLQVIVNQMGRDPSGERLAPIEQGVEFDHDPALHLRIWDAEKQDTVPSACDLEYIVARNRADHRQKTSRDQSEIAKIDRLTGVTKQNRRKRKWPTRKMAKPAR